MSGQAFLERLKQNFGDKITGANLTAIDPWIEVCKYLRDEPDLRFNMLNCISGVDYFEPDAKKAAKSTGSRTWKWSITCSACRTRPAWC